MGLQIKAENASYWTAEPGASEHHSGLAIDLGIYRDQLSYTFDLERPIFIIYQAMRYRYGLIVRYAPSKSHITGVCGEPWH